MQLNGIKCVQYTEDKEAFIAVLSDTTQDAIQAIQAGTLELSTDTGNSVKKFLQFGAVESIEQNFTTGLFTARFPRMSGQESTIATLQQQVQSLAAENTQLTAKVKAANEANAFLEECLVEVSNIVYA